jgi:hypothetical protein
MNVARNLRGIAAIIAVTIACGAVGGTSVAHDTTNIALIAQARGVDLTHLPVGDTRRANHPQAGWIWACAPGVNDAGGAKVQGPWFNGDGTFDLAHKAVVQGAVTWPSHFEITVEGDKRVFASNDLPNHPTGVFPIAPDDPAFAVDHNPSHIAAQSIRIEVPLNPTLAPTPSCLPGAVGITLSGVALFDALDAEQRDAVAHEVQDSCQGHPQITSTYHYHSMSTCIEDKTLPDGHSALMGYALDGFGIYGHHGAGGKMLTSADLDECHGHIHKIEWNGHMVEMYHYHATWDFPYTIGCLRGNFSIANVMTLSGARPGQRGRPNLDAAAAKLGVSPERLREALGPPPPDFAGAARKLGVSIDALREAMGPPPRGGAGMPPMGPGMRPGSPPP